MDAAQWTPPEPRRSFVSLLPDAGVPIEKIARLVGHAGGLTVWARVLDVPTNRHKKLLADVRAALANLKAAAGSRADLQPEAGNGSPS